MKMNIAITNMMSVKGDGGYGECRLEENDYTGGRRHKGPFPAEG